MTEFKNYKPIFKNTTTAIKRDKNKVVYDDDLLALDCEFYSYLIENGKAIPIDKNKLNEDKKVYDNYLKQSFVYIWQFAMNHQACFGRNVEELRTLFEQIRGENWKICFVHNLGIEFQCLLRNICSDLEVFALKPRHPVYARSEELKIEFRCSYKLTNLSLAKAGEEYGCKHAKACGDLQYDKPRNSFTELTPEELNYCEMDVIVLNELIEKHCETYGTPANIPLTSTGKVRREGKKIFESDNSYHKKIVNMSPKTFNEFNALVHAYMGGQTHANPLAIGRKISQVFSADISSSYPTSILCEKFPMSRFTETTRFDISKLSEDSAFIYDITFTNLQRSVCNTYLSKSKAIEIEGGKDNIYDNGKITFCRKCRFILTDVDMLIVQRAYDFEAEGFSFKVNHAYRAKKDYLDRRFLDFVLKYYEAKTKLKNVVGREDEYRIAKEYINSLYGCMVQNLCKDEVIFDNVAGWKVDEIAPKNIPETEQVKNFEDVMHEKYGMRKTFLSYAWGVYVAAYARYNLMTNLLNIDTDVVYCDTDSIKFTRESNFEKIFEHNDIIDEKMRKMCEARNIDFERTRPTDKNGVRHPLGHFEVDGVYEFFKTYGAKRYCVKYAKDERNNPKKWGKTEITVAGVSKKNGSEYIEENGFDSFTKETSFNTDFSGKLILYYNDNQQECEIEDYQGNKQIVNQKFGICFVPTTYSMKLNGEFKTFLEMVNSNTLHTTITDRLKERV